MLRFYCIYLHGPLSLRFLLVLPAALENENFMSYRPAMTRSNCSGLVGLALSFGLGDLLIRSGYGCPCKGPLFLDKETTQVQSVAMLLNR